MSVDFARIKEVPIADVVGRYNIPLRYRGEWGAALCPLPSHKQREKEKTFSVNTQKNYWKCFSQSCNEQAGCKGGDTINFVALMDGSTQLAAAKKLAGWFGISDDKKAAVPAGTNPTRNAAVVIPQNYSTPSTQTKTASHMEKPSEVKPSAKCYKDISTSADTVKYMASIDAWFDETVVRLPAETDEDYRKRFLKGLKKMLLESYRSGQKSKAA